MQAYGVSMNDTSLQFDKCYFDSLKIILNHSIQEDMLLSYISLFKNISLALNAEIKINQATDSVPPEIPRITIVSKEYLLNFGLNRIEVSIKGSRKHVRYTELYPIYKHQLQKIELLIQDYLNQTGIKENFIGILAPIRYPQYINLTKDFIIKKLYERLVTKDSAEELANFSFKIGLKCNNIYENYEISDYEVKNVTIQPSLMRPSVVNLDEFPTVERGILIIIDVNNKPQLNHQFSLDCPNLINNFFNAIKTQEKIFRR
jgi:hypothetical protein